MSNFRRLSDKQHSVIYRDLENGEYDSVVFGSRRYVDLVSYRAYVERARLGLERDPDEKRAAQAAYRRSLVNNTGAKNAARARRAIGKNRRVVNAERGEKAVIPALARPQV
jgi:hypothetical protein